MLLNQAYACWQKNGIWTEGTPAQYFAGIGRIISLVGGGGKTSLMYHLAHAFQATGEQCAVMTTTKIYRPQVLCATPEDCKSAWNSRTIAVCGEPISQEKLGPPPPELMEWLLSHTDRLFIEADGAKHLPCKMPAVHEPVIPAQSDTVIAVAGLDAIGKPLAACCFRPELVCDFLSCTKDHRLTPDDLAQILFSTRGGRKNVQNRNYYVVLNKCDTPSRLEQGKCVARQLAELGHTQTIITKLRQEDFS